MYTPPSGAKTTITYVTKLTNGETEITVESILVPSNNTSITILANKVIKIKLPPNAYGKANLYLDDKDKSKLYVNYFLNYTNEIDKNTLIEEFSPVFDCEGNVSMLSKGKRILEKDEKFGLQMVIPGSPEETSTWFKVSDQITVYKKDGITKDFYLVNRFDRNAKYILELENREAITYNSKSLDFGALTIPFKYRFGFKKNEIKIKDDVTANANIGLYTGFKLTRYSIINKTGTYLNRTFFSLRVGPFLNLSTTTLDSLSTTVGKVPMKKDVKQNIAVLSTGVGLMADFKGVQMGLYSGWDFGTGSDATDWNYHKRFWLGIGIGFKITDLFAQK